MRITITLPDHSYPIDIQERAFHDAGLWISQIWQPRKVALITDENVRAHYASSLQENLDRIHFKTLLITLPSGEKSKNLMEAQKIYELLADNEFGRHDGIIALGGGVVGDIAGFIASTYQRGLSYIQIPTTLLAQVDSSIGGKTGLNLPQGKNQIGTFWQPDGVLIDPELLRTLPLRRLREGLAEVVKYAAIADQELFQKLEEFASEEDFFNQSVEVIGSCCRIKKQFVEKDEKDRGPRFFLNFGHTLGHGIEQLFHYETYTHGEAVAIGMNEITRRTELQGHTEKGTQIRLARLLEKFHLPLEIPQKELQRLEAPIMKDKKGDLQQIRMVRLKKIGEAELFSLPKSKISAFLEPMERTTEG